MDTGEDRWERQEANFEGDPAAEKGRTGRLLSEGGILFHSYITKIVLLWLLHTDGTPCFHG